MSRVTQSVAHLPVDVVKAKLRGVANATQRCRWLIVYNVLVEPRAASSIARHTGVSVATVRLVMSTYNRRAQPPSTPPAKAAAAMRP